MSGTSVSIETGIWHHIAIVLEKNGDKTFFINGTEFSRSSSSPDNISTPQYPLCFGSLPVAIDSTL